MAVEIRVVQTLVDGKTQGYHAYEPATGWEVVGDDYLEVRRAAYERCLEQKGATDGSA